ncbi:RHS repeat-associated core domain-containing protein [Clostridium felsineum]|uniref:RHS repeat-associated core domain-containing protein n=1 Tax=Clostridium felsineum TaxID=36839 RepID=UPI001FA855B5
MNPYRYREYRYDSETGLYYLQSRYYNPEWGRFVNADGLVGKTGELISHNLFAYCVNNPVNLSDSSGCGPELALLGLGPWGWAALGVCAALSVIVLASNPPKSRTVSFDIDKELAQARPISNKKPSHEVYVLINNRGKAQYVGRTSLTTDIRFSQHKRTPIGQGLTPKAVATGVDYATARGVEQIIYDHYKLVGNDLRNSINPIAPKNPNKWYYMLRGAQFFVTHPDKGLEVIQWDGR